jgi:hypothetical protein
MLTGPDSGRGELGVDGLGVKELDGLDGLAGLEGLGVAEVAVGAEVDGAGDEEPVGDVSLHPTSPTNSTTKPTSLTPRR